VRISKPFSLAAVYSPKSTATLASRSSHVTGTDQLPGGDSTLPLGGIRKPHRPEKPRRGTAALVGLLVLVALLGVIHIIHYPTLSPYDEIQHLDSLEKNSRFDLVGRGDLLSQETMRETACHGTDFSWSLPPCDADSYDPADFPWEGWNTAYTASPLYYGVTGIAGRIAMNAVPGLDSLLTSSRIVGIAWALLAAILMWGLLGEFSLPDSVRFSTILLVVTAPTVLHVSSIVNPDITGVAGGAAVAWLTLRWERGASPAWLLVVAGTLTVLGKPLNIIAIGVMIAYLGLRYVQQRSVPATEREHLSWGGIAALLGGAALGTIPWIVAQGMLATAPTAMVPQIAAFSGGSLTLTDVSNELTALVSPLQNPYLAAFIAGPFTVLVAAIGNLLMIGANIGVALVDRGRRASALATATLISALLLGPAIMVFVYLTLAGMVFPVTVRYGLPLLPMFAVGLATAASVKRSGRIVLGLLAVSSLVIVTIEMVGVM
jgi:hypothetical protein